MGLVLPANYRGLDALTARERTAALSDGRPPVRLGIVNLMPFAEQYELELAAALARTARPVQPVWLKLRHARYKSSDPDVIAGYSIWEEALARNPLDGLIVTGAPVETLPFETVDYWPELNRLLDALPKTPVLGLCWGGLVLAKRLGLEKRAYARKRFGVFRCERLDPGHSLTTPLTPVFDCPVSTHAGVPEAALEAADAAGHIRLLARSAEAGVLMFESVDGRFVMHMGHPEYGPRRLPEEYRRDRERGRGDVHPPLHVDLDNPTETWRDQSDHFFNGLIERCAVPPRW